MQEDKQACQNCDRAFKRSFKFCPHCGQKSNDQLTLGVLFYNTISNYFSFDARFFKSFIPLMIKPGYLARKFIEGRRLLFLHPANLYLFVSVVFFFILSLETKDQAGKLDSEFSDTTDAVAAISDSIENEVELDSVKINQFMDPIKKNKDLIGIKANEIQQIDSIFKNSAKKSKQKNNINFDFDQDKVDSLLALNTVKDAEVYKAMGMSDDAGALKRKFYAQMLKFYKNQKPGAILNLFYDSIPIAMFILLPIFALILKLLYFRKGTFTHHLVFSFYYFSFLFTSFSMLFIINYIYDIPDWMDLIIVLSTFIYLLLAVKRFYRQGYFLSFIKSSVATFLFLILVLPLAAGLVAFSAFMLY
ncbi:MAG: hypothetical protein BM564_07860 [Bacteroidetes bacterium MedPE-SWsnd-G2]|nr:MAG: hypothetical protein BM564_07860 [Bacteroidetes bacterium MedPE-SWsnd-G2]